MTDHVTRISNVGILSLVLSRGVTQLPSLIVSLLLVDIASNFDVPVGVAGQIRTAASILGVVFGLIMGLLSVRYRQKSLLSVGLILYIVVAVSAFFTTSLAMLVVVYSLVGVATAIVAPMVNSLIGQLVYPDKRTTVMGWTVAGMSLIYLIGSLSVAYVSQWGWRMAFLVIILPLGCLTCVMCRVTINEPEKVSEGQTTLSAIFSGYRKLFQSRSSTGCILGTIFSSGTWGFYLIYGFSFWRQEYNIGTSTLSMAMIFTTVSYIIASLLSGRLVKRFSEKTVLWVSIAVIGCITIVFTYFPTFWVSFLVALVVSFFAGLMVTLSSSYALGQLPEYRGTMMSLNSVAASVSTAITAGVGGALLVAGGYGLCTMFIGGMGVLGAVIYLVLTSNPILASNQ